MSASNKLVDPRVEVVARAHSIATASLGGFDYEDAAERYVIRDHAQERIEKRTVIVWQGNDYEEYLVQLEIIPFQRAIRALDEYEAREK